MLLSFLSLTFIIAIVLGGKWDSIYSWVDVCTSPFGKACCSPGIENYEYLFLQDGASWLEHEVECVGED